MHLTDFATALPRRKVLGIGLAGLCHAAGARAAAPRSREEGLSAHFPFGPVAPRRPAPAMPLTTHAGATTDLGALLNGRVSAVQLMFTGCSATCPIQGALFSQAQIDLGKGLPEAQFVSISIDPLTDTPARLAAWLRRFDAKGGWLAALPQVADVDRLVAWLGEGGEARPRGNDPHTGQVYIVDRRGALAFRTPSSPPPANIVAALRGVAGQA